VKQFFKHASSVLIDGAGVDEWLATALSVKQKVEEIVNIFIQRMAKKKNSGRIPRRNFYFAASPVSV